MSPNTSRLTTYLLLMIGTAYIFSIGLVHPLSQAVSAAEPGTGSIVKKCRSNQNVTVPLIDQMLGNLINAHLDEKLNYTNSAVDEIKETEAYLNNLLNIYDYLCR